MYDPKPPSCVGKITPLSANTSTARADPIGAQMSLTMCKYDKDYFFLFIHFSLAVPCSSFSSSFLLKLSKGGGWGSPPPNRVIRRGTGQPETAILKIEYMF
jgi:hypothetical protein